MFIWLATKYVRKSYHSGGRIRKSEEMSSSYYVHYNGNWDGIKNHTCVHIPKNQNLEDVIVKFIKVPESRIYQIQESRGL